MLSALSPLLRTGLAQHLTRDALLALDPEIAHKATISALRLGLVPRQIEPDPPSLTVKFAGFSMTNPVGMAAGFDKNAEVVAPLGACGFGAVEVGTLTPRPQPGNPIPRLFRVTEKGGIINAMGFNNGGFSAARQRLESGRYKTTVGVNLGANKDSADFVADFVAGVKTFAHVAKYLAVNISSPNTVGLRDLHDEEALKRLLGEVLGERARRPKNVPIFLKLSPDLDEQQMDAIASVILATDLDGLIVANTTVARDAIAGAKHAKQRGGLSGRPLFELATRRLAQMRQRVGPKMPIIGVGGGLFRAKRHRQVCRRCQRHPDLFGPDLWRYGIA